MASTKSTLSTVIRFKFKEDTFNVSVASAIKSQGSKRPALDVQVTETVMAMINALFLSTNLQLQAQFSRHQKWSRAMLLAFFMILFCGVIIYIVFENNRAASTSITIDNDLIFFIVYAAIGFLLIISGVLFCVFRRIHHKLRAQWRNECVRNLCESAAVWSMQFPLIQFETKFPGFMYHDLLKAAIKKARKSFKDSKKSLKQKAKEAKKNKKKNMIMRSPRGALGSPLSVGFKSGFSSMVGSPIKYDRLGDTEETDAAINTCKLGFCCCLVEDNWGFIRVFYKYDARGHNDGVQFALNELQKSHCLVDQDDPHENNVHIIQMVAPSRFNAQSRNMRSPKNRKYQSRGGRARNGGHTDDDEQELEVAEVELMEGSEPPQ